MRVALYAFASERTEGGVHLHMLPLDDLYPHEATSSCWCQPFKGILADDTWLHNAVGDCGYYQADEIPLQ